MQGDLISRSALIEEIESLTMHITGLRAGKGVLSECMKEYKKSILRIIDEQPTAYNVEKVVAELEEKINVINSKIDRDSVWGLLGVRAGCKDAIEIVNNGWKE